MDNMADNMTDNTTKNSMAGGEPGWVSKVCLDLGEHTHPRVAGEINELLKKHATYHMTFRFRGHWRPDLVGQLLRTYRGENPFSILRPVLESGDPRVHGEWVAMVRDLAPPAIPGFGHHRDDRDDRDDPSAPLLLCPWQCLGGVETTNRLPRDGVRRWVLVAADMDAIKAAVAAGTRHRMQDGYLVGYLVRGQKPFAEDPGEGLLLLLYVHYLYGDSVNIRFEDPLADGIYRVCLRRENPVDPGVARQELHYSDDRGIVFTNAATAPSAQWLQRAYQGIISILSRSLELQLEREP